MARLRARLITWRPGSAMTDAVAGWPRLGRRPEALPAGGTRWEGTDISRWPGCGRLVGESGHIEVAALRPAPRRLVGASGRIGAAGVEAGWWERAGESLRPRCGPAHVVRAAGSFVGSMATSARPREASGDMANSAPPHLAMSPSAHARDGPPGWGTLHPPPATDFTKRLRELLSRAAMDLQRMCAEREHVPSGIRQLVTGQLPPDGMNGACAETGSGARRCA